MPNSARGFLTTPCFRFRPSCVLAEPFIRSAPADAEESIAQFVLRRLGQEFLDYAIDPLVAGIYAGNPHLLSVSQAFPKLHALEQRYRSLFWANFWARGRASAVEKFPNKRQEVFLR
jgi:protoporphyrinogen/coproporphyrinogen III oxidase